LGSSLLECRALPAFLPKLCKHILGENLLLPVVQTWWCGEDKSRKYVINNIEKLVITSTFDASPALSPPIIGETLSAEKREVLIERLNRRGYDFVGHEIINLSTMPVWSNNKFYSRPMTLRAYLAASSNTYMVMPGGLVRVSNSDDARAGAVQRGCVSKDAWVLSEQPVDGFSLLRQLEHPIHLRRGGKDVSSRAADNLYWLGRYAERSEGVMRLLRSLMVRLAEYAGPVARSAVLNRLVDGLVRHDKVPTIAAEEMTAKKTAALEYELKTLVFDPDNPSGLHRILEDLHRTATMVRDRLSIDAWRTLNMLQRQVKDYNYKETEVGEILGLLNDGIRTLAAFSGMEMENMTRSHGWRFLDMGRRIERALYMVGLLHTTLVSADSEEFGTLELLLELADSFMTYRSRYLAMPRLAPVLDLLLADETNPRSVAFQISALDHHVESLPRDADPTVLSLEQRILTAARTELRLLDIIQLCDSESDSDRRRIELDGLLQRLAEALPELSDLIARSYFSHAEPAAANSRLQGTVL
jgi:uncharacterized alpha-E superfamily protein